MPLKLTIVWTQHLLDTASTETEHHELHNISCSAISLIALHEIGVAVIVSTACVFKHPGDHHDLSWTEQVKPKYGKYLQ